MFHSRLKHHSDVLWNGSPWYGVPFLTLYLALAIGLFAARYDPGDLSHSGILIILIFCPLIVAAAGRIGIYVLERPATHRAPDRPFSLDCGLACSGNGTEIHRLKRALKHKGSVERRAVSYVIVREGWVRVLSYTPVLILLPVVLDRPEWVRPIGVCMVVVVLSAICLSALAWIRYSVQGPTLVQTQARPFNRRGPLRREAQLSAARCVCRLDRGVVLVETPDGDTVKVPLDRVTSPWSLVLGIAAGLPAIDALPDGPDVVSEKETASGVNSGDNGIGSRSDGRPR